MRVGSRPAETAPSLQSRATIGPCASGCCSWWSGSWGRGAATTPDGVWGRNTWFPRHWRCRTRARLRCLAPRRAPSLGGTERTKSVWGFAAAAFNPANAPTVKPSCVSIARGATTTCFAEDGPPCTPVEALPPTSETPVCSYDVAPGCVCDPSDGSRGAPVRQTRWTYGYGTSSRRRFADSGATSKIPMNGNPRAHLHRGEVG
jgi:hypothetical protein